MHLMEDDAFGLLSSFDVFLLSLKKDPYGKFSTVSAEAAQRRATSKTNAASKSSVSFY